MPKKLPKHPQKKLPQRFFDPVRTGLSPEDSLRDYLAQTEETLLNKSADILLQDAESALRKTKNPCGLTSDEIFQVICKAITALGIAAKKYEKEKKVTEATCVYQLIESQTIRQSGFDTQYQAPQFR